MLKVQKCKGGFGMPSGWYVTCGCCEQESDIMESREDARWMAESGECSYCANDCETCAIRREYPEDFALALTLSR